jgi:3-methylfumaryl-CoA hydratase
MLDLRPAVTMAAMLNRPGAPRMGDILPPLWQWIYFAPAPLASEIGTDGHPARGGFLPPVPLPRRMWAASKTRFITPLRLGETVQKQSRIDSIKLKQGASGPLVFVTADHLYSVDHEPRISEKQTLVYVGKNHGAGPATGVKTHIEQGGWSRRIEPDPVMLFRYSALTANTHRIHYDRDYATREEGYPGLLVHAPWTVTLLAELLHENCPGATIKEFSFRALRPLPDTAAFMLHGQRKGDEVIFRAVDTDGQLAVNATALLAWL